MPLVNKTFRPTPEDIVLLKEIMSLDPRCENTSKVLYFAFLEAHSKGIVFKEAAKFKLKSNAPIEIDPSESSSARSFSVEEEDWEYVVNEFKTQLDLEKVRISYLARLLIAFYRMRLGELDSPKKEIMVETESVNAVDLLLKVNQRAAELLKSNNVEKILEFLEEA